MAGYVKIWTTIESDGWFLSLSCLARGLWIQLIIAAKAGAESGQVWGKSWGQLAQRWGLSRETCAKNLRKFADAGKVTLETEDNGTILITIHNYLLWQGVKGPKEAVELHHKRRKPREKSHGTCALQNSSEQSSSEQSSKTLSGKPDRVPYQEIIADLNQVTGKKYRHTGSATKRKIAARFNDGFTLSDFQHVHKVKAAEWLGTDMEKFLRPETLYGNKFEGYLNQGIEDGNTRKADNTRRRDRQGNRGHTAGKTDYGPGGKF